MGEVELKKKAIMFEPHGGLGDNLAHTTLPRLLAEKGFDFYIERRNEALYRNREIFELLWEKNPYFKGFIDDVDWNATSAKDFFNICNDDKGNILRVGSYSKGELWHEGNNLEKGHRVVWAMGRDREEALDQARKLPKLSSPSSMVAGAELSAGVSSGVSHPFPEIYYEPKYSPFFKNKIIVDFGIHTQKEKYYPEELLKFLELNFDMNDVYMIHSSHTPRDKRGLPINNAIGLEEENKTIFYENIYEYCDIIYSCKKFICLHSGSMNLAAAVNRKNKKIKTICLLTNKVQHDVAGFCYDNIAYINIERKELGILGERRSPYNTDRVLERFDFDKINHLGEEFTAERKKVEKELISKIDDSIWGWCDSDDNVVFKFVVKGNTFNLVGDGPDWAKKVFFNVINEKTILLDPDAGKDEQRIEFSEDFASFKKPASKDNHGKRMDTSPSSLIDFNFNKYSQRGDDGIIQKIFEVLNISKGYFIEFGAWDGIELSNCKKLYDEGWSGCFIESNEKRFEDLRNNYKDNDNIKCLNYLVSPTGDTSLDEIILRHDLPEIDFLSIDVDGDDYEILESLKVKPRVICVEGGFSWHPNFEERVPKSVARMNLQQPIRVGISIGNELGYKPVCFNQNLYLVRNDNFDEHEFFRNLDTDAFSLWKEAFDKILGEAERYDLMKRLRPHALGPPPRY